MIDPFSFKCVDIQIPRVILSSRSSQTLKEKLNEISLFWADSLGCSTTQIVSTQHMPADLIGKAKAPHIFLNLDAGWIRGDSAYSVCPDKTEPWS